MKKRHNVILKINKDEFNEINTLLPELFPNISFEIKSQDDALVNLGFCNSAPCVIEFDLTTEEFEALLCDLDDIEVDAFNLPKYIEPKENDPTYQKYLKYGCLYTILNNAERGYRCTGKVKYIGKSFGVESLTNGKVYTIEVKYNQEDVNVLKQDVKNSAYEIAGVPLATSNTTTGITGTAQKTGGGWENAEIKMNGRIVGMQKNDYSILKCLIEVCKIVLGDEFTNVNSNLIDITYKLSMNDNIMSKCQSASYLYDMKMPLELILKITRLSNDPSSDAKKWQDRIDELDKKEFEKQLASAKIESVKAQQSSEKYSKQKKEEQEIASQEKGINKKGKVDMKGDN